MSCDASYGSVRRSLDICGVISIVPAGAACMGGGRRKEM